MAAPLVLLAGANEAGAQRRPAAEFTQQSILVSNFGVTGASETPSRTKADLRLGREVGDWVRRRLEALVNKRETKIISGFDLRESVIRAGFAPDDPFTIGELRQQGQTFRTDEIVTGVASKLPNGALRLEADLVLYRDIRLRQPIPAVTANSFDRAVEQLAQKIAEARVQLRHQRRCENSLRDAQGQRAIQHAREGVAAYPAGALVRTCLVWALRAADAPASLVLAEAEGVLKIDPVASHALESAAGALDSLRRRDEAATMWLRLQATDSTNLELAERVVWALAEGGNARRAEPLILRLTERYPDNLRLTRQLWRVAHDNRSWKLAVASGEKLLAADAEAANDSIFFLRLATAYRADGQHYRAVEIAARGVAAFPGDPRIYALYTQFVKAENDSVLPRGLALFPANAALLALNAREQRARGQLAEALESSRRAVELDSTIAQGRLLVAQAEMELGRPDSALLTLGRAVASGEDSSTVADFALSKGNALLRAANGTDSRQDFQLAMRFLAFADSLQSTPQTKFVLGAAALKVAQTALTEAPRRTVREESCAISRIGHETIPLARASLEASRKIAADAARQFLEYLDQLAPFADKQVSTFCSPATGNGRGPTS